MIRRTVVYNASFDVGASQVKNSSSDILNKTIYKIKDMNNNNHSLDNTLPLVFLV